MGNKVYCQGCGEKISVRDTIFEDIEEGIDGADIMTFECVLCGEIGQRSEVYGD